MRASIVSSLSLSLLPACPYPRALFTSVITSSCPAVSLVDPTMVSWIDHHQVFPFPFRLPPLSPHLSVSSTYYITHSSPPLPPLQTSITPIHSVIFVCECCVSVSFVAYVIYLLPLLPLPIVPLKPIPHKGASRSTQGTGINESGVRGSTAKAGV